MQDNGPQNHPRPREPSSKTLKRDCEEWKSSKACLARTHCVIEETVETNQMKNRNPRRSKCGQDERVDGGSSCVKIKVNEENRGGMGAGRKDSLGVHGPPDKKREGRRKGSSSGGFSGPYVNRAEGVVGERVFGKPRG